MKITYEVQFSAENDAFTNSRRAQALLLESEGHEISDLKRDLVLVDFQNLVNFPDYLTSISHTKGAGASALAKKSDYQSIGIDIEWSDRVMKEGTEKFYKHPEDSEYPNSLELWTMKEAAFKALSPLGFPGVLVLSKIIIRDGVFWTNERPELRGRVCLFDKMDESRKLNVALAFVEKV